MSNEIDEIKSRLPIEELIGEYIQLKPAGSSFMALCPFHNEKTPSFNVSPSLQIYKCFGCGESGDIFSFVQKIDGVEFKEALKKLADKTGVQLTNFQNNNKEVNKKNIYFDILENTTSYFQINLLQNENAKEYLKKRGVNEETVRKFKLGFATDEWHGLLEYLKSRNFSEDKIIEIGLAKKNEKGNVYDRFRNRIIFPIFNFEGRPIAYSGRDLSFKDDVAKYLNSPENPLFNKSSVLYGFNFAKSEIRKRGYVLVVEGQMDLIMNHQIGFENTVATSGTALTDNHLKKLSNFTTNIIFSFDADEAGENATFKAIQKALKLNFSVKVINMEQGKDPADMILKDRNNWTKKVAEAMSVIDFLLKKISYRNTDLKNKLKELHLKVFPLIFVLESPMERGVWFSKISNIFEIKENLILDEFELFKINYQKKGNYSEIRKNILNEGQKIAIFSKDYIMNKAKREVLKQIFSIYFWQKKLLEHDSAWVKDVEEWFDRIQKILLDVDNNFLKKVEQLNDEYINTLIIAVEKMYSSEDKIKLINDVDMLFDRLNNIINNEKILLLQKQLKLSEGKKKQQVLQKIQKLYNNTHNGS